MESTGWTRLLAANRSFNLWQGHQDWQFIHAEVKDDPSLRFVHTRCRKYWNGMRAVGSDTVSIYSYVQHEKARRSLPAALSYRFTGYVIHEHNYHAFCLKKEQTTRHFEGKKEGHMSSIANTKLSHIMQSPENSLTVLTTQFNRTFTSDLRFGLQIYFRYSLKNYVSSLCFYRSKWLLHWILRQAIRVFVFILTSRLFVLEMPVCRHGDSGTAWQDMTVREDSA